jgi:serine/threonine-protein kinase
VSADIARLTEALSDRYRIERELGQGGMATVYLAHDVRHDRKVALKVLRPELSAILGAERFLHEIKTTANLQHPHILSLFDSGEAGGFVFYVMPYVEGESLRDRLKREQQLPVEDAVRIAREVADALDYAHQHGVVHRDIKPENILLHGGHAQVADFGIALAASRTEGSTRMTETGMSLGTPHYMSPEQAMGQREITPRSDIYALGCVLYEMLTAEPPFVGATPQAIIARVLTEEPRSLTTQRKSIPPHVEAAVARALEKLPADRFTSAGEFGKALGDATFHGTGFGPHGTLALRAGRGSRAARRVQTVALGAAVLFAGLAAWGWFRPAPPKPEMRYGLAFAKGEEPTGMVMLSHDGGTLAYYGPGDSSGRRLWVKEQGRFSATPLAGTDAGGIFTLSPDARWVAFTQNGKVSKLPLAGGTPTILADSAADAGIAWLDDGTLVFTSRVGVLMRVAAGGGPAVALAPADSEANFRALATPLPGARGVLFTECGAGSGCNPSSLHVMDLATGTSRVLVPGALRGWYLPMGTLLYVARDGRLFAVPFDLKRLELGGTAVPILSDIALLLGVVPNFTVSDAGTVVMQSGATVGGQLGAYDLVSIERAGTVRALDSAWQFTVTQAGSNVGIALSPDGTRIAIGLNTRSGDDIWIKRLPTGTPSRLTFDSTAEARPRWTADGRYVSYLVDQNTFWRSRADGTGVPERIHTPPHVAEGIWSHDGRWLIFRTGGQVTGVGLRNIYGIRVGDTTVVPLAADPRFDEEAPALSPDGRWLAYESSESGRTEVYVRPFPDVTGGKWQASTDGGEAPLWSHSGRELYFVDPDRNVVAMPVAPGVAFTPGDRVKLFHLPPEVYLGPTEHYTPFDITPDDRRFIFLRQRVLVAQSDQVFLRIENWFPELQRLMKEAK